VRACGQLPAVPLSIGRNNGAEMMLRDVDGTQIALIHTNENVICLYSMPSSARIPSDESEAGKGQGM